MLHHSSMARSQAQSDFSITRASEVRLPGTAAPIALAPGEVFAGASELATRWVLRLTFVLLAVFAALCAIGPHIPAGE